MLSSFMMAVLAVVASEQQPAMDYAAAYKKAQTEGKPLMVVVGTDWCPACVSLKQNTLPAMKSSGALSDVALALVDRDHQPQLAGKLTRGQTIPQIILYSKNGTGGWSRMQLTGNQSRSTIRSMIDSAKSKSISTTPASVQVAQ